MKTDVIAMLFLTIVVLSIVLWEGTRPAQYSREWQSFVTDTRAVAKRNQKSKRKSW